MSGNWNQKGGELSNGSFGLGDELRAVMEHCATIGARRAHESTRAILSFYPTEGRALTDEGSEHREQRERMPPLSSDCSHGSQQHRMDPTRWIVA